MLCCRAACLRRGRGALRALGCMLNGISAKDAVCTGCGVAERHVSGGGGVHFEHRTGCEIDVASRKG